MSAEREQRAKRDKLAKVIEAAYDLNPGMASFELLAHAVLAAGYRKTEPKWAETLINDGTYEYTASSDCDGSNVTYWRRTPGKFCIEDASAWEQYEPVVAL